MKKEINRVLGNSLRCILPSFWWKRLLGKMVDKIESAESSASSAMKMATLAGLEASDKQSKLVSGSNIKTINNQSILGSGNITIEAGGGVEQIIFYATENDASPLTAEEIAHNVESMKKQRAAFINNTPVSFLVSVKGAGYQICETPSFYLPSNNTDIPVGFYIVCGGSAQVMVTCNWDGTANMKDVNWIDSELSDTSKNPVQNKVVTNALNNKADKSQIPTKLSQLEKDIEIGSSITVDSELSETSTNPVQNKVVTEALSKTQKAVRVFVNPNELETLIQEALADQYHWIDIDAERFENVFGTFMKDNEYDLFYMDIAIQEDSRYPSYWSLTERWEGDHEIGIEFTKKVMDSETRDYTYTSIYLFYDPEDPDEYTLEAERWVIPESELRGSYTAYVDNAIANAITNTLNTEV